MRYDFTPQGAAEFYKLPLEVRRRIADKVEFFLARDEPLAGAQALTGALKGVWRFRIGDYRVLFEIEENCILIVPVGHQRDVYRR